MFSNIKIQKLRYIIFFLIETAIIVFFTNILVTVITKNTFDALIARDLNELILMSIYVLLTILVIIFIRPLVDKSEQKLLLKNILNIRTLMFNKTFRLTVNEYKKTTKSEKMVRMSEDINTVERMYKNDIKSLFFVLFLGGGSLILMFYYHFLLTVVILVIEIISVIYLSSQTKKLKQISQKENETKDQINNSLQDLLKGYSVLNHFRAFTTFFNNHQNKVKNLHKYYEKGRTRIQRSSCIVEHLSIIKEVVVIGVGIYLLQSNSITIGTILGLIALKNNVGILQELPQIYGNYRISYESVRRIDDYLSQEEELLEPSRNIKFNNLVISNMYFSYDKPLLQNINVNLKKGDVLGIFGGSGLGKSTIIKLLLKHLELDKGKILVDDCDYRKISKSQLYENISYISQTPYLFNLSIEENIKIGKANATSKEIDEACKKANIYDFVQSLPLKYKTIISEDSSSISGGERQRISLARALIKDSKILIFDELSSSLDEENFGIILKNIRNYAKDKIVIFVSHNKKLINLVNKKILLEDKRFLETNEESKMVIDNCLSCIS